MLSHVQVLRHHGLYSLPGSSAHGIPQARILEWVATPRGSFQPRNQTWVSCIAGRFFTANSATPWTVACQASLSSTISQSLLKLMSIESVMLSNHLLPHHHLLFLPFHTGHGVLQARILEYVAISSSSGPHFVRTLHYDLSILGGPARQGS